jgi:pimeloyl-ACP methyl ester carboxylesterase
MISDRRPPPPRSSASAFYAGKPPRFDKVTELEAYFRTIYKPYGHQTDAQWRRMAETSVRRLPDGGITTHYDPNMVMQFTHHPEDNLQWAQWEKLDCEVLCLRGAESDLLTKEIAVKMQASGPRCRVLEIQGCGHAPCLNVPEQIGPVREFLANGL